MLLSPEVQIPRYKLRPLVDSYPLWTTMYTHCSLRCLHDVMSFVVFSNTNGRTKTAKIIYDCQTTDLTPLEQLVVHKIHTPAFVTLSCHLPILPQLRHNTPLWRFIPHLKSLLRNISDAPFYDLTPSLPVSVGYAQGFVGEH